MFDPPARHEVLGKFVLINWRPLSYHGAPQPPIPTPGDKKMSNGNFSLSPEGTGTLSRNELSASLQEISRELEGLRSEIEKVGTVAQ